MTLPAPDSTTPARPGEEADAREFESFARNQNPLDIEAATWATRRRSGLGAAGAAELQAWLDADPRHAAALEDMEGTFGDIRHLPAGDVATLKSGLPARAPSLVPAGNAGMVHEAGRTRRAWWSGLGQWVPQAALAVLVVMAVGGGWLGWDRWQRQPTFDQAFGTGRGQQLTVRLPDDAATGSTLQLDTATRLEARLYRDRREVRLMDGQAMFAVHPDAQRPFHVMAGNLRITVVGTRFSVRHTSSGLDAGRTVVSVEEGRVRVVRTYLDGKETAAVSSAPDALEAPVELTAGLMLAGDNQGRLGTATPVSPSAIAQWRQGRISFDHTPLEQALAEFERYGRTGLVIRDPAVARMPVGGSYDLRQFQQFVRALPEVLPVHLVQRGDATEVVAR